jgi:hypothetical protein
MFIGNAVVDADPLVPVVVSPHAVVKHVPTFLNELSQTSTCLLILRVFTHVIHLQDHLLAHDSTLDGGVPVVQQVSLVLLNCLL